MDCIPMRICTQCFACVTVQATVNTSNLDGILRTDFETTFTFFFFFLHTS